MTDFAFHTLQNVESCTFTFQQTTSLTLPSVSADAPAKLKRTTGPSRWREVRKTQTKGRPSSKQILRRTTTSTSFTGPSHHSPSAQNQHPTPQHIIPNGRQIPKTILRPTRPRRNRPRSRRSPVLHLRHLSGLRPCCFAGGVVGRGAEQHVDSEVEGVVWAVRWRAGSGGGPEDMGWGWTGKGMGRRTESDGSLH